MQGRAAARLIDYEDRERQRARQIRSSWRGQRDGLAENRQISSSKARVDDNIRLLWHRSRIAMEGEASAWRSHRAA